MTWKEFKDTAKLNGIEDDDVMLEIQIKQTYCDKSIDFYRFGDGTFSILD